ncbi:hypothetical protein, partial [Staphylococcus aureus]|uniref:hypothetical protein n=1 Tax=Staphylococcus aureus TaxID=1280 RepID=UPI001F1B9720
GDLQVQLAPRHASATEARISVCCLPRVCSPFRLPRRSLAGSTSPTNYVAVAEETSVTKPALQNGLSLARDDWSSRTHHHEVNVPDLLFQSFRQPAKHVFKTTEV